MKLVTFNGETPASALKKAQAEFGEDALVVSTKEIRKKSFKAPALYEVVIAIDDESASKVKTQIKSENKAPKKAFRDNEDVFLNISEVAKQITQIANVTEDVAPTPLPPKKEKERETVVQQPIIQNSDDFRFVKLEMEKLNDKLKLIQNMFWEESSPKRGELIIPPEFAEIYKVAKQSGMTKEHLDTIMKLTLEHMPSKMRESSSTIKRYFQVLLRKMVPIRIESELVDDRRKIMMLVGPTGVGKTTTLAKLAARYSYMLSKKYKVGIITLDTYRIAAVDQLMHYAKIMKLGIETVIDPPEFLNAINSLKNCDYILIDTVGSSQYDKDKIDSIRQFINSDPSLSIDVNLVIPANVKYEDLKEIYSNFAVLNIDTFIFTKLDETRWFGNIFSLVYDTNKPVSYLSVGQEVPSDLMVASNEFLIDCLLDGFRKQIKEEKSDEQSS